MVEILEYYLYVECGDVKKIALMQSPPTFTAPFPRYKISPIFPVLMQHAPHLPDFNSRTWVGAFFFTKSFKVIGELLNDLDFKFHSDLWFSHGLAGLIVITEDEALIKLVKAYQLASQRASEIWKCEKHEIVHFETVLAPPQEYDSNKFQLNDVSSLNSDDRFVFQEFRNTFAKAVFLSAQYSPRLLPKL